MNTDNIEITEMVEQERREAEKVASPTEPEGNDD